jgi:hypothetical protein
VDKQTVELLVLDAEIVGTLEVDVVAEISAWILAQFDGVCFALLF